MYIDKNILRDLAERALNTKAGGKADWCIEWLERIWNNEITTAICEAKRPR
jgi:hypothetical protein